MPLKCGKASLPNLSTAVVFIRLPEFREELSRSLREPVEESEALGRHWAGRAGFRVTLNSSQQLWGAYWEITGTLPN